ncbi:hypothetical protein ACVI1L_003727 [Bradyrhizobium sp. USDA 4516]
MSDVAATAQLREVLEEVLGDLSEGEAGARAHVTCKIIEAVGNGETSIEALIQVGRKALLQAPTMWRERQVGEG